MAKHQSNLKRRELALRAIIQEAVRAWPQLDLDPSQASDGDLYISGADMLEWFCGWRQRAIETLYDRPHGPAKWEAEVENQLRGT
jgi:hypothetical protein